MCVCFCLGACAYSYSRVCVRVGWCEGKNPSLWFTHHSVWPAEILSFSGRIAFFFFFFLSVEVFFFEAGKAKWEPLTCTFSSREEIRMIDVIFQETASEKNTWSENVTYYPFFFVFLRCELVLKIAHIHFDFRVKHCELWQNGGRKCWGQVLACCRKKNI